jgi:1,4-dihydroxy-2-naphthoate octaprenyltransferase
MNIWVHGSRPRTLPAAIAPVVVGTSLTLPDWNPINALLALIVSLALQVGVNFANDYSDGIKGTDADRIGPVRLTAAGLAKPNAVKAVAFTCFAIAAIAGLQLALSTSLWLLLIGAISITAAWGYTGGKSPYGYRGFGEFSVFIFFGVVATVGTFYVQTEQITLQAVIASLPMGSLACSLLVVNNLRDREKDSVVGKRTLAVRLGDSKSRIFYVSLLVSAHVFALLTLRPWAALTLLAAPLTVVLIKKILSGLTGMPLVEVLAQTGKLQLFFATLFAVGLAL